MVALALSSTAAMRKDVGDLRGAERLAQVAEIVQASGRADEAEALENEASALTGVTVDAEAGTTR